MCACANAQRMPSTLGSMNWGFASSLAVLLLATTLVGFLLVNRVVGLGRIFEARA